MIYELKFSGTMTVTALDDWHASYAAMLELPPGADIEIIGRSQEPPPSPQQETEKEAT
jgi:hypothetical protein